MQIEKSQIAAFERKFCGGIMRDNCSRFILLLSAVVLWIAGMAWAQPSEVWVCPTGDCGHSDLYYNTVQAGITAVASGGIVHVKDGTYNQAITIAKPLTLRSENGAAGTILDGNSATVNNVMVTINASNVTVDGFTITNPLYSGTNDAFGIYIPTGTMYSHIRIANCIIHDIGTSSRDASTSTGTFGIYCARITHGEFDHNKVYNMKQVGTSYAAGIAIAGDEFGDIDDLDIHDNEVHDVSCPGEDAGIHCLWYPRNVKIRNNLVYNCEDYDVADHSEYPSAAATVISGNDLRGPAGSGIVTYNTCSIIQNKITGCGSGIWVHDNSMSLPVVFNNHLAGNIYNALEHDADIGGTVNASGNWWGTNTPADVKAAIVVKGGTDGEVDYTPWLDKQTDKELGTPGFQGDFSALWVGSEGGQTGSVGRIQEGVDMVTGSTVHVAAGTYQLADDSPIKVNKAVTLIGDVTTPSNVVVKAPLNGAFQGRASCFVISHTSGSVTITGFTIKDAPMLGGSNQNAGVWIGHTGNTQVWGVDNVTIESNVIDDCANGINMDANHNITIKNNVIKNSPRPSGTWTGIGINAYGRGNWRHMENLDIEGNQIYGNKRSGIILDNWQDPPPLPWGPGGSVETNAWYNIGATIKGNSIHDNGGDFTDISPSNGVRYRGIEVYGHQTGVSVEENAIYGHVSDPAKPGSAFGLVAYQCKNVAVKKNTVYGNHRGIRLYGSGGGLSDETTGHAVENNFIYGNVQGLQVEGNAGHCYSNSIHDNNAAFSGMTNYNIWNSGTANFDASGNWYGSNDRATFASTLSSYVDYTPWLNSGTDKEPGTIGFQGDFSNLWVSVASPQTGATKIIQEGVDLVTGSTVNVSSGTYNETVNINKTVTLVGNCFPVIDGGGSGTLLTIAASNVSVTGLTIQNAGTGVLISSGSHNSIRFNNILNHTVWGMNNATSSVVNAEYNWWGDVTGPLDNSDDRSSGGLYNGGGTATSKVSDNVDYDPWIGKTGSSNPNPGPLTFPLFAAAGHSVIKVGGTEDIDLVYLGNNFKGCTAVITFVGTVVNFVPPVTANAVLGDDRFALYHDLHQTTASGTVTIDIARLASGMLNNPGTIATIRFKGIASGTSPITLSSIQVRDENNNPVTVGTTLNEEITVDGIAPTITLLPAAGGYYKTPPAFTTFSFHDGVALDKGEYKIDAALTWTAIFSDVMGTDYSVPWTLPTADFDGLGSDEASHTIHFKATDDATNETIVDWQFYKDVTAPAAVTGVTATPGGSVHLTWTVVPHATGYEFDKLEIRRTGWGGAGYPTYPEASVPSYPGNTEGMLVTTIIDGATTSYPDPISGLVLATRNVYYYQLFVYDKAGNVSSVNASAQARATNYLPGDIAALSPAAYDNTVNFNDLIPWSLAYGTKLGDGGYNGEYDFGPTDNHLRLGIPQPWSTVGGPYKIEFEDLMIFAMNYNKVLVKTPPADGMRSDHFALELKGQVTGSESTKALLVTLHLANDGKGVKGSSIVMSYDASCLLVEGVSNGTLFGTAGQTAFFYHRESEGKIQIDAAALGTDNSVNYSGDIATIRFKVLKAGDYNIGFIDVKLRDAANAELTPQYGTLTFASVLPTTYDISQNYPNPFNPTTVIAYQLPEQVQVDIAIYNALGQKVATVVSKLQEAGYYKVEWNGRNDYQQVMPTGVYFFKMVAGDYKTIKKMMMLK
jgi:nitrous oxidase accessory protein